MDFYVNEFMETNQITIDKPFKVENVNRPLVINTDGTMLYQDTEEVVPIGVVFSILSGAYKVVKDTDDVIFKNDEMYYFVSEYGTVLVDTWCGTETDCALLYMGNAFKTRKEAEDNIDYVLGVYKSVNKKTSILPNSKGAVKEDTIKDSKDVDDSKQSATLSFEKDKGGTYSGYVSYINNKGNVVIKELDSCKSLSDILKMTMKDVYSE